MITHLTPSLIGVTVPKHAKDFKIDNVVHLGYMYLQYPDKKGCIKTPLPQGNWSIVGEVEIGRVKLNGVKLSPDESEALSKLDLKEETKVVILKQI